MLLSLTLSACSGTGGSFNVNNAMKTGTALLKMYVQNQCIGELQSRNEWRLVALTMSRTKQQEWENKICSCVSEEAPNHITAADLPQLMSENGRVQMVANVTTQTVTACYQRLFSKTFITK
ncbi:MAG: hypothetical protein Q4B82_06915 [Alysiella sp.]|nr:hypothetical protein [Alysiella sp.]